MYLREKLTELKILTSKIEELERYLFRSYELQDDIKNEIVKVILNCIDEVQNIKLILNNINKQTSLKIAEADLDLGSAVTIRDTIDKKIKLITNMINSDNTKLDILTLMGQRGDLLNEFNTMNVSITLADWSIKID